MSWPIEVALVAASAIGTFGVFRMLVSIATTAWYDARLDEINNLVPFDCARFHEIQQQPKPWYVKVNDKLERWHI